jgi:hypothetical protein
MDASSPSLLLEWPAARSEQRRGEVVVEWCTCEGGRPS